MGSSDTSLWAYARATQGLGKKQKEVLDALWFFPDAPNAEIAARLNWPVNRITPRCLELRKMGLILDAGKRTCRSREVPRIAGKLSIRCCRRHEKKKEPIRGSISWVYFASSCDDL